MTVLPVSKQLFPQSALFEHRGVQHLLVLEARHTIRPSPVVNLLRETYHEVVLLTMAQRDARVASPDRKIKASIASGAFSSASSAWAGSRSHLHRLGHAIFALGPDADMSGRSRASVPVLSRDEIVALLADALMLAGGRQRTITAATLAIGFSLVVASFVAFAAAALVPDWLTLVELEIAKTAAGWSSLTGAAFVLLSLSPTARHRERVQYVAMSFGAFLGTAWALLGDVALLRTLVAPGFAPDWAVIDPPNTRFFVAYQIAQELLYIATWCVGSFALVALAIASRCTRRVSTRLLLTASWAHLGGASLFLALNRAVTVPLEAVAGVWVYADAKTSRPLLVLNLVASVFLLAQAIATQFVGIRHRLVRLIARVCCSASGAEASLAPLLGFGSRYGERAPDDVCAEAERAFRPCTLTPNILAQIATNGLGAHFNDLRMQSMSNTRGVRLRRPFLWSR
ncbi:hypothetical protein KFE25_010384 [Diacronema lutheri]|uniref:Uncharacterized protein n=1 Tax=Diacronema lutheri TaxID=2081491 RepID=A0A8J5XL25_DIALT|nr:hypothetical protein KFE25_010384 [Diacronema lutheri]